MVQRSSTHIHRTVIQCSIDPKRSGASPTRDGIDLEVDIGIASEPIIPPVDINSLFDRGGYKMHTRISYCTNMAQRLDNIPDPTPQVL